MSGLNSAMVNDSLPMPSGHLPAPTPCRAVLLVSNAIMDFIVAEPASIIYALDAHFSGPTGSQHLN